MSRVISQSPMSVVRCPEVPDMHPGLNHPPINTPEFASRR